MRDRVKIVIIGGGAIGLSIAYHLGLRGENDVLLLERNELTSGTSWHAAGIVGPLRATLGMTKLAIYATELFSELEGATGQATGYVQTGGMWLAQNKDRMTELRRIKAMGDYAGLNAHILSAQEVAGRFPYTHVDDIAGALWVEEDGQANPVDICMAYAKGARGFGITIKEHLGVQKINMDGEVISGVTLDDGSVIDSSIVINATGVWSHEMGGKVKVPAPVQAVEHMYIVSDLIDDLPAPCPIIRDLDSRIYLKGDAGKLVLGGFEPNAKPWDVKSVDPNASYLMFEDDWDQFEPFMMAGLHRFPVLETAGVTHFMNGPEGFTPDTKQVMGPVAGIEGYYVAAGFNSLGIVSSAGVGRALADWVMEGEAPGDLWEVDNNRFDIHAAAPAFLKDRMREVVSNQFDMHWPYKQLKTGRNVRRSVLHRAFKEKGAFFGAPTGWERPLWFAQNEAESRLDYSYAAQSFWPVAAREAKAMSENVGIFELSPFTKINVEGPDALNLLQYLCVSDMDTEIDVATYTQMLNSKGGIEADITVTRLAADRFRMISGAATRVKDLHHIKSHIKPDMQVYVSDVTSSEAVLGVMGPKSRELLSSLSESDLSSDSFPFGHSKLIDVGMAYVRATRVSFVGELGWELYIPIEFAELIHEMLCDAGEQFGLVHAGHMALDGCRMEKGFRHWNHDIGPADTPLEAGLGFAIDWEKEDFLGKAALKALKEKGVERHLILFDVKPDIQGPPLLLHDEIIWCGETMVGLTTSGGMGPRTGLNLTLGYVSCAAGMSKKEVLSQNFEVEVAGRRYQAIALAKPPHDPAGLRMRG